MGKRLVCIGMLALAVHSQRIYNEFLENHGQGGLLPDDVVCQAPVYRFE